VRVSVLIAVALAFGSLHGVVSRAPTKPVCVAGESCSAPAPGAVLLFERTGARPVRVHAGATGRYSVRLTPGLYLVRAAAQKPIGFGLHPDRVRVWANRSLHIDFTIDTGIR
jgi:hypothetical protein